MNILFSEILGLSGLTVALLLVFLAGELARRRFHVSPEMSRKAVHIGSCLVALFFPVFLATHWSVLALAACATVAIVVMKRRKMLPSLDDVGRVTLGSVYHPAAIYLCFFWAQRMGMMVFYEIAMLVLAFSDSTAALTGVTYGRKKYLVEGTDSKSLEGSTIFLVVTFLIVEISLLLFSHLERLDCILVALLIAVLVTLFEAISMHGADNLAIPLGTMLILSKNIHPSTSVLIFHFAMLAFALLYVNAVAYPFRKVTPPGVISMVLGIYTAGTLVSPIWMLPMAVGIFAFCRTRWFIAENLHPNRVRPAFYLVVVPVFWILAANLAEKIWMVNNASMLFLPSFITAVIGQMLISRQRCSLAQCHPYGLLQTVRDALLINLPVLLGVVLWCGRELGWKAALICLGTFFLEVAIAASYACLLQRRIDQESRCLLRFRMLLVFSGSLVPAVVMLIWRRLCLN